MAFGVFWLFLEKGGQQLSSFIVFAIIARLIGPEEYGLVALCGLFISIAVNVVNGIVDAVISLRVRDDLRLSTLFWIVMLCGILLSLVSYGLSDAFADLMDSERLASLLKYYSVLPVLLALAAVPTVLVSSSMNFRVFTIRTLIASIVGGIAGIAMAMRGSGAYALAIQQIVFYSVMNIIVWPACGWRPRVLVNPLAILDILRLGAHQVGSSLVGCLEQHGPRLILGYIISPFAVGQYTFVLRICGAFQEIFIQPLLSVIYPAFAIIRDDRAEHNKILGQVMMLFGALVFPLIVLAMLTAPVYLPLLFGDKWESTIPYVQLMIVSILPGSLAIILRDLLRAHKLIGAYFRWQTFIVLIGLALSAVSVSFGLYIFMAAGMAVAFVAAAAYTVLAMRQAKIPLGETYVRLLAPFASSVVMYGGVAAFLNSPWRSENPCVLLLGAGAIIYGALEYRRIKSLIAFIMRMSKRKLPQETVQAIPEDM